MRGLSGGLKEIPAFVGIKEVTDFTDGFPERVDGPGTDPTQMSLELGEGHLDRGEIWTVRREKAEQCATLAQGSHRFGAFVRREIVENDDVALVQDRGELCFPRAPRRPDEWLWWD